MSVPSDIDRIRVQTARMLEIYSLLRKELDGGGRVGLSAEDRRRLQHAVDTIAGNMSLLLAQLTAHREDPSAAGATGASPARPAPPAAAAPEDDEAGTFYPGLGRLAGAEARELEEIIDALLKWHATVGSNQAGD